MNRFLFSLLTMAAIWGMAVSSLYAENQSLFAPAAQSGQAAKTSPAEPVSEKKTNTPPLISEPPQEAASVVGNEIQVEDLAPASPLIKAKQSLSPEITVDSEGRKTLTIKGEPSKLPSSSNIVIDENGRKTLVLRGDDGPKINFGQPSADQVSVSGKTAEQTTAMPTTSPPATPKPAERPYWEVDPADAVVMQPYFLVEEQTETVPYWWDVQEKVNNVPPWQMKEEVEQWPYYLEKPKDEPKPVQAAAITPSPSEGDGDGDVRIINYYRFQDEKGVTHLTNVPNDSRYKMFTLKVKVQVTVQRGLAGKRVRFTHNTLRPIIMRAAATYDLDPALIAAVIKSESAFDSQAVSWAGAQGLMQLMPGTARDMGCLNPFDPEQNVMGGSRYLRLMLNRFKGDLTLAIAAYNCGPERVARNWRVPNIAETQNYVKIVTRNYESYKLQF